MMIGGIPGPKRIGIGLEARAGLLRGAATVGHVVGTSLGPSGRAVLIERRHAQPWVSTDGYTIARHIDLGDRFEDMGGRLIRHVGSKVTDEVGDGSTTAMVLAAALMEEGHRAAAAGADPMSVMRGMERGFAAVTQALDAQSRPLPAERGLERVARLASNGDDEIARHLADAIRQVGPDGVVTIEEAKGIETELSVHEGMSFDKGYVSPAFVTDARDMTVMLEDAYVLMHEKTISSVGAIEPALRAFAKSSHTLLIVAEDVVGDALATLIVNKQQGGLRVVAVKAPGFGRWRKLMLEDIAVMTGGQIVTDELGNKLENLKPAMMGAAKRVHVARDRTTIVDGAGDATEIAQRCNMLRREAEAEKYLSFDREKLQERLARLCAAIAHLRLGGATEAELRARKERATDALNAARAAAAEGVVPGGGVALVQASRALGAVRANSDDEAMGISALEAALKAPMRRIVENAGGEGSYAVARTLAQDNPRWGFDAAARRFRDLSRAGIVDPVKVVRMALRTAVPAAARAIAAEAIVAGSPPPAEPETKALPETALPGGGQREG